MRSAKRLALAAILGVGLFSLNNPVVADDAPTAADIKALLQRLEAAEKRNQELEKRLESIETSLPPKVGKYAEPMVPVSEQQVEPAAVTELDQRIGRLQAEWSAYKEEKAAEASSKEDEPILKLATQNFTVGVSGYTKLDSLFFAQDTENIASVGGINVDSLGFRQARFELSGTGWGNFEYKYEIDLAGARVEFKDVWAGLNDIPFFDEIVFGHKKAPFSLNELTSDKWITFFEPALPNLFVPQRKTGMYVNQRAEDYGWTLQYGVYRGGSDDNTAGGVQTDADAGWVSRVTFLPWYDEYSKRGLLHIGGNFGVAEPFDSVVSYSTKGELIPAPGSNESDAVHGDTFNQLNTGNIDANTVVLYGTEVALVVGPAFIENEFIFSHVNQASANGPNLNFWGSYVTVGYFLTGESRASFYDTPYGWFDKVTPIENAFFIPTCRGPQTGWGAWEVAGRWSYVDLEDGNISFAGGNTGAGTLSDLTFGVNWYMTPGVRIAFNYVHSFLFRQDVGSDMDAVGLRAQYVW
ncbi:Porin O precursor [Planctomycetes bacterium Pan216]|uniref:Porin O n=1 Tax=Kolteria novifilia TaxID=2527975 RepID=A0A518AY31_9BACT|nr:Porin O precursor [Planctomycetes bacterium Pan216]